ncbi:hypothetical protein JCM11957_02410 [Caminibacter profundus]
MNFNKGLFVIVAKMDVSEIKFEMLKNDFKKIGDQIYKTV